MSWPLHESVRTLDTKRMCDILTSGSVNVNAVDNHQRTALHIASWKGASDLIRTLLLFNADTKIRAMDAFTCLHFAAQQKNSESVSLLLEHDKSIINAAITKGRKTALHLAAAKGNKEVVSCLLRFGANVDMKTSSGQTALDLTKDEEVRKILQKKMVKKNAACDNGGMGGGSNIHSGVAEDEYKSFESEEAPATRACEILESEEPDRSGNDVSGTTAVLSSSIINTAIAFEEECDTNTQEEQPRKKLKTDAVVPKVHLSHLYDD